METSTITQHKLGSYADFKSGRYDTKQFIFVLNHINQKPSYSSSRGIAAHYPPSYRLLLEDNIYDTEKNMMRTIRYIPGEMSIFKDEQTPDDKVPKQNFHLEFINGDKLIGGRETLLIKYLMLTNKNGSNPNRDKAVRAAFFTVDPGESLKSVMESDELASEAQHFCYKGAWDEVAAYAMVLGMPLDKDPAEIRYSLRMRAKENPKAFLDGLNSKNMKRKYFVMEAINQGILKKNSQTNTISWRDGGVITQAPIGKDMVDDFVDSTFTTNGEKVFQAIMAILRPEEKIVKVPTELVNTPSAEELAKIKLETMPVIPQVVLTDITNDEALAYLEKGVEKGCITFKKPMWYTYKDQNKSKKDWIEILKTTPTVLAQLKADLYK